ncbi:helix-turn-helix transcriptional regulator [Rhizobium sp. CNPSo 3968]|uniref:helix-turn-helix domain-containing protein n=1 Tax=Rhizobium sp. CNPSo 3968 TaxID=3021408 RepID=UPI00254F9E61|nr:helix-turn-helix transcriptional regulator [Rhizobium sp. CNPSo 3968]MDK4720116.1 helix-turn-helix transcriptional regulator [Rhizobium sp. CNPSo 3968]
MNWATTTATGENILKYYREGAHLTQSAFAAAMGMPLRSYQDVEAGKNPVRPIHVAAAHWALITLHASGAIPGGLPFEISETVRLSTQAAQGK